MEALLNYLQLKEAQGQGFYGHGGRIGKVGGSTPRGEEGETKEKVAKPPKEKKGRIIHVPIYAGPLGTIGRFFLPTVKSPSPLKKYEDQTPEEKAKMHEIDAWLKQESLEYPVSHYVAETFLRPLAREVASVLDFMTYDQSGTITKDIALAVSFFSGLYLSDRANKAALKDYEDTWNKMDQSSGTWDEKSGKWTPKLEYIPPGINPNTGEIIDPVAFEKYVKDLESKPAPGKAPKIPVTQPASSLGKVAKTILNPYVIINEAATVVGLRYVAPWVSGELKKYSQGDPDAFDMSFGIFNPPKKKTTTSSIKAQESKLSYKYYSARLLEEKENPFVEYNKLFSIENSGPYEYILRPIAINLYASLKKLTQEDVWNLFRIATVIIAYVCLTESQNKKIDEENGYIKVPNDWFKNAPELQSKYRKFYGLALGAIAILTFSFGLPFLAKYGSGPYPKPKTKNISTVILDG